MGNEINVNVSEFIKNINPFDKPQVLKANDNIKQTKQSEFVEKKEKAESEDEEEEDEEESNFFLKSVGAESNMKKSEVNIDKSKNESYPTTKNLELSNILQFVNILKKKNIQDNDEVQNNLPKDPRIKNKKK